MSIDAGSYDPSARPPATNRSKEQLGAVAAGGGVFPSESQSVDAEAAESARIARDRGAGQSKHSGDSKKRIRPQTIVELFEYAYREAGRKLNLARDLTSLSVGANASRAEVELVRQLAKSDQLLAVPPSLLAALAELQTIPAVQQRILDLMLAVFADHELFRGNLERLADVGAQPALTAREISNSAKTLTIEAVNREQIRERRAAIRERLRVNAVTGFELFRVLRDGWTLERFIGDMCALVWDIPTQHNDLRSAALLASAKNVDVLSQLSRHFELLLHDAKREAVEVRGRAGQQQHRAEAAEAHNRSLEADLLAEQMLAVELRSQVAELEKLLSTEQGNRAVDKSHLVDDYVTLRAQVIRQLNAQTDLLSDGLHAIRNGRMAVAEEFVDRALNKISGEVKRLKGLHEGEQ